MKKVSNHHIAYRHSYSHLWGNGSIGSPQGIGTPPTLPGPPAVYVRALRRNLEAEFGSGWYRIPKFSEAAFHPSLPHPAEHPLHAVMRLAVDQRHTVSSGIQATARASSESAPRLAARSLGRLRGVRHRLCDRSANREAVQLTRWHVSSLSPGTLQLKCMCFV